MTANLDILLIEDDNIEIMKIHRAIKFLNLEHHITEANNGIDALNILKKKVRLPDIILLDLNIPKMNGIEFLSVLKDNPVLNNIPTIILTTSNNRQDLTECYKQGIAGYLLKPLRYEDYVLKIEKLLSYWSINELVS